MKTKENTGASGELSRRDVLKFVGLGTAALCAAAVPMNPTVLNNLGSGDLFEPSIAEASISYGNEGYHLNSYKPSSKRLIIGCSWVCQLWKNYKDLGSFVAVWSGHYSYGRSVYGIDNPNAQRNRICSYVEKTLKKYGKCTVFVVSTDNDCNDGSWYISPANNVYNRAVAIGKIKVKYKGKNVKPKVYVFGNGNGGSGGRGNPAKYNAYLKKKVDNNKSKFNGGGYLNLADCREGSNHGYENGKKGDTHFNATTLKNFRKKILDHS